VHLLLDDEAEADYQDDVLPVPGVEAITSEAPATVAAVAELAERGGNTGANRPTDAARIPNLAEVAK
jgi:hypothetical protein